MIGDTASRFAYPVPWRAAVSGFSILLWCECGFWLVEPMSQQDLELGCSIKHSPLASSTAALSLLGDLRGTHKPLAKDADFPRQPPACTFLDSAA